MQIIRSLALLFFMLFTVAGFSQEICDNGIDDDNDGLIDLNDIEDCECSYLGGNTEVESLIPNASFEDTECCPSSFSQLNCAETWIQASFATSDYMNECDFMPSVVPQPLPDGSGCVGAIFQSGWMECVGACLNEPFIAGEDYLLNMQIASNMASGFLDLVGENDLGPIDITIYGSPNCSDLPFAGSSCPLDDAAGDWEVIGFTTYEPLGEWGEIIFELNSTVDINAIVIGPPCTMPDAYANNFGDYAYFMYDDLILNEASAFASTIDDTFYDEENDVWVDNGSIFNEDTGEWEFVGQICSDIVQLTGSVDTIGTYQWYYEGVAIEGETDTIMEMPWEEFQQGEYQFVLFVEEGCASATYVTTEPEYPVADYSMENVCFPDDVEFTDESTHSLDIINYWWEANGNFFGSAEEASEFFDSAGPHEIDLMVQSANFCWDTLSNEIVINHSPVVDFSIENACIGEVTEFVDETTVGGGASLSSWSWDFDDDDNTSSNQNPNYTYNVYQEYYVTLEVEADNGCVGDTLIIIEAYPTPQVAFSSETICIENPTVTFVNESTIDDGSTIDQWAWTFGDTQASDEFEPANTYAEAGEYDIELIGTSNFGCVGSATGSQMVSQAFADFTYDIDEGCSPFCTEFTALPSTTFGSIALVEWDFGNGEFGGENVMEACYENGSNTESITFDVEVTVTNSYGCQDVYGMEDVIEVWPNPLAAFDLTPDRTDILSPEIEFFNSSVGAVEYQWDLGNGYVSSDYELTYTYDDALIYPVTLTAISDKGCTDEVTKMVDILPVYNIYIPNSFSPQGDGINEVFKPVIYGGVVEEYKFEIRNKWNDVVWETNNVEDFWNGSYKNNNDYYVKDDTYIWVIEVKFERLLEPFKDQGTLTVFR